MPEVDQRKASAGAGTNPAHPQRRRTDRPRRNRHVAAQVTIVIAVVLIGVYYALRKSDHWLIHVNRYQTVRDSGPLLARIGASGLAVSDLGRVEYDGAWQMLPVARRSLRGATKRLCVFAGVHGNEATAVEAAVRFAEQLGRTPGLYPGINVSIVPLVNPWGWARNLRHNGANRDISRSFLSTPSTEAELIKPLLAKEPCDMLVDLHGDRANGPFYIVTYENPRLDLARSITREVRKRGIALRAGAPDGVFNRSSQDSANQTRPNLGLYARKNGVPEVYIVQTPRQLPIEERVQINLLTLERLAAALAK